MLVILLIIGGFTPVIHSQAEEISLNLLTLEDKVISGRFFDSLLLSLPPCSFIGRSVNLEYLNCDTNKTYVLQNIFTVPACGSVGDRKGSTAFARKLGYQLMNLDNGTQYKINYKIGNITSNILMATTRTANYIDTGFGYSGRSAAMVVITVILSVAAFILLISILVSSLVSRNEK